MNFRTGTTEINPIKSCCSNISSILSCIVTSYDSLLRNCPDAGVFVTGDFNSLNTSQFNKYLNLSQIVKDPTRKNNILDKIFTNCSSLYASPIILPPVGKSDHNCVLVKPTYYTVCNKGVSRVVTRQCISENILDNLAFVKGMLCI